MLKDWLRWQSRFPRYFSTEEKLLLTVSKVHLYRELSCDEVLQRIESLEEEIISKGVKLVIIDSVASVVRKEFDTQLQGNMRERNKFLAREAASLKYLAEEFSIPITGPPGCGKTQFCIMMSILATLPIDMGGLEGAVVYIDTESAFSAERLVEMAESFSQIF